MKSSKATSEKCSHSLKTFLQNTSQQTIMSFKDKLQVMKTKAKQRKKV
jgi:hypothetical protein